MVAVCIGGRPEAGSGITLRSVSSTGRAHAHRRVSCPPGRRTTRRGRQRSRCAIEAICASDEEMVREIRDTVVHEVAHHFGIDDDRLEEMEL